MTAEVCQKYCGRHSTVLAGHVSSKAKTFSWLISWLLRLAGDRCRVKQGACEPGAAEEHALHRGLCEGGPAHLPTCHRAGSPGHAGHTDHGSQGAQGHWHLCKPLDNMPGHCFLLWYTLKLVHFCKEYAGHCILVQFLSVQDLQQGCSLWRVRPPGVWPRTVLLHIRLLRCAQIAIIQKTITKRATQYSIPRREQGKICIKLHVHWSGCSLQIFDAGACNGLPP